MSAYLTQIPGVVPASTSILSRPDARFSLMKWSLLAQNVLGRGNYATTKALKALRTTTTPKPARLIGSIRHFFDELPASERYNEKRSVISIPKGFKVYEAVPSSHDRAR